MITRAAYQDPITFMFTRHLSTRRKVLMLSVLAGLIVALLCGGMQFFFSYHKRDVKYDNLITDLHDYMADYFKELRISIDRLQPLTLSQCHEVSAELTSRAAFSLNVRAFLLVKDKIAFCSSATGPLNVPLSELVPNIDVNKDVDMALLPGTPMMPKNRPLCCGTETRCWTVAAYLLLLIST